MKSKLLESLRLCLITKSMDMGLPFKDGRTATTEAKADQSVKLTREN